MSVQYFCYYLNILFTILYVSIVSMRTIIIIYVCVCGGWLAFSFNSTLFLNNLAFCQMRVVSFFRFDIYFFLLQIYTYSKYSKYSEMVHSLKSIQFEMWHDRFHAFRLVAPVSTAMSSIASSSCRNPAIKDNLQYWFQWSKISETLDL